MVVVFAMSLPRGREDEAHLDEQTLLETLLGTEPGNFFLIFRLDTPVEKPAQAPDVITGLGLA
jgi:hypothetical protein